MRRIALPVSLIANVWDQAQHTIHRGACETEVEFLHGLADADVRCVSRAYFIGDDDGPIKIGHSVDARARLSALTSEMKRPLRILATAPGGRLREAAYHLQFERFRVGRERFERCEDILQEIEKLR